MKPYYFCLCILSFTLTLISCSSKRTEDPSETYRLWAGYSAPDSITVINGKYWESPHFTREYIMYMELKATPTWCREFIRQNDLLPEISPHVLPEDAPEWFLPGENHRKYVPSEFSQGSLYFFDTLTSH